MYQIKGWIESGNLPAQSFFVTQNTNQRVTEVYANEKIWGYLVRKIDADKQEGRKTEGVFFVSGRVLCAWKPKNQGPGRGAGAPEGTGL
jgi:hypothetical protein